MGCFFGRKEDFFLPRDSDAGRGRKEGCNEARKWMKTSGQAPRWGELAPMVDNRERGEERAWHGGNGIF